VENDSDIILGKAASSIVTTIPPGSMTRIVLPIKKMILSESDISKPIPTLSDRQFVVTKSDLTDAEQKLQRELFWYREELFKSVQGHWQEVSFPVILFFSGS
jgi:trafficking protein particle complex subunit 9